MKPDSSEDLFSDHVLTNAMAALLTEIRSEPVPESISLLAGQLQAALDQRLKSRSFDGAKVSKVIDGVK